MLVEFDIRTSAKREMIDLNPQATILGPGETVPVRDGTLLLGTWQAVMLVELDGPRQRRVVVTVR